jgi:MFS family permease
LIVTYQSWRVIFWFQAALAGVGTIAVFFLLPETIHRKRSGELAGLTRLQQTKKIWSWMNPVHVIQLLTKPNLLIVGLASSALTWNMCALLTPIRYVLNPAFHLSSPLQSGLFYLAPGCGYLFGALFGGRWADRVVKKHIDRRGIRIPEDRLKSSLTAMGLVTPACMLIYGWSIDRHFGGIALPVITMFLQGVAQLFSFPSLNTYCLDVMPGRSSEVVASNYFLRYTFAAAASAACLPMIQKIGVGWTNVVSALFVLAAAGGVLAVTIIWGHREKDTSASNEDS